MLNQQKPHIGIFGQCNTGKSTFINTISEQSVAIVSDHPGTTTDPVKKSIELGAVGPAILIDTAGLGDISELGQKRMEATDKVVQEIDLGIIFIAENKWTDEEKGLVDRLKYWEVPFFVVHNKADIEKLDKQVKAELEKELETDVIEFSSMQEPDRDEIIAIIKKRLPKELKEEPTILGDLVNYGDLVVLVTPIDIQAPKGRLILPQVQTIRNALDNECIVVMAKERELDLVFRVHNIKPKLVITDSQAFLKVQALVPKDIPLTSFSILQARLKGSFEEFIEGTYAIDNLKDGDRILIQESCSHHVGGEDIGRVKIPRWLELYTGKKFEFEVVGGLDKIAREPEEYALVIQCGGCMLTRKQVHNKLRPFLAAGIPVSNYGLVIAYSLGIFERSLSPFKNLNVRDDIYL
jgi:[FeFe] hydrogenase H-cluster maturation GTPase HydF